MEGGGGQNEMITEKEIEETDRMLLLGNESELIMLPNYSNNKKARHYREQALDFYQTVYNRRIMDAMVPYVAMNFFDRVISKLHAPPVLCYKQENFTLFLVSCLSISWKMRENNYDICTSFLWDRKMRFGNKGLMRMEMSILNTLDWRMKQTVPFQFVPYFLHFLTLPRGFDHLPVYQIIVWTQADIRFTKFRPSTVAASAIICASAKLFPDDPNDFASVILSRYTHSDTAIGEELAECVEMMQTTYRNKMNTLMVAKGLINDDVGTSQQLNLVQGESSTEPRGSGKESIEEGSQRHGKEIVAEEVDEGVEGIQTMPEKSSSPADGRESLEEGSQGQGKESVAEEVSTAVETLLMKETQSSSHGDGRESIVAGSERLEEESFAEEGSTEAGEIQMVPKKFSSPGDGRESPVKQSLRPGKEPIHEESSEETGKIQMVRMNSSCPGDGLESSVKRSQRLGKEPIHEESSEETGKIQIAPEQSHRPGKEPVDEESSKEIGKMQMASKQSSYTSNADPEMIEEGFCRPREVPMVEIQEEPELGVADNPLRDLELGWDDQNPYSHGYGMCSLCDALARWWPIPIFEAQEQTLEWLCDSWEWLLSLPTYIGIPNGQMARRPWESNHEADNESSPDPSYRIQDFFARN